MDESGTHRTDLNPEIEKKAESLLRLSPSFIKLMLSGNAAPPTYLVIKHGDLSEYLASKAGLPVDKHGGVKDLAAYKEFVATKYSAFIDAAARGAVDLDLDDLAKFLGMRRFGNVEAARRHVQSYSFARSGTLADFGVGSREELVQKYFTPIPNSPCFRFKSEMKLPGNTPAFIGLLIDQGYRVTEGDVVPTLSICPPDA